MTKKAYVIGSHVSQSLSPLIFNYWLKQKKIKGDYCFKEIKAKNFDKEIDVILREKNLCGFNVTIPYKELIIEKLDKIDKHAEKIGAVNCVTKENGLWLGKNTDWIGFLEPLGGRVGNLINKKPSMIPLVIGYGGAAKAVIYALRQCGIMQIKVYNRTFSKVEHLQSDPQIKIVRTKDLQENFKKSTLIINTTPTNIFDDGKKIYKKFIGEDEVSGYDIVYAPKETRFLSYFEKNKRYYGIDMLVGQAAPCFKEWFGKNVTPSKDLNKILKKHLL